MRATTKQRLEAEAARSREEELQRQRAVEAEAEAERDRNRVLATAAAAWHHAQSIRDYVAYVNATAAVKYPLIAPGLPEWVA